MADWTNIEEILKRVRKAAPSISKKNAAKLVGEQIGKTPLTAPTPITDTIISRMGSAVGTAANTAKRYAPAGGAVALGMLAPESTQTPAEEAASVKEFGSRLRGMSPLLKDVPKQEAVTPDIFKSVSGAIKRNMTPEPSPFDRVKGKIREKEAAGLVGGKPIEKPIGKTATKPVRAAAPTAAAPAVNIPTQEIASEPAIVPGENPTVTAPAVKRAPAGAQQEEPDYLAAALMGTLPAALGGLFGGWEGAARGGQVGENTVGGYFSDVASKNKEARDAAAKVAETEGKQAFELDKQGKQITSTEKMAANRLEVEKSGQQLGLDKQGEAIKSQEKIAGDRLGLNKEELKQRQNEFRKNYILNKQKADTAGRIAAFKATQPGATKGSLTEKDLEKQTQLLSKNTRDIGEASRAMEDIDRALGFKLDAYDPRTNKANGRDINLPGFSVPGLGRFQKHTARGRALDNALMGLLSKKLYDRSGAAVTPPEFERLRQEWSQGAFNTENELISGIQKAKKAYIDAAKQNEAGFHLDAVATFKARGGRVSPVAEDNQTNQEDHLDEYLRLTE